MKIVLFILLMIFIGCENKEGISFAKIEDNIKTLESLNKNEILIAQNILEDAKIYDYKLISTKELESLLENGADMQIIATIPKGIYILGFIKGAKNFEFKSAFSGVWEDDTKNTKEKFFEFLGDKNKKIIFYDNGENSARSGVLWAKKLGYNDVYLLAGNFQGWKERNFEISFDMPECCRM